MMVELAGTLKQPDLHRQVLFSWDMDIAIESLARFSTFIT